MSGLAPTAEILSFAWPKESIQRKSHPVFRLNPVLLAFGEGFRKGPSLALRKRAASLPLPYRADLAKSCDARGGITGENHPKIQRLIMRTKDTSMIIW